MRRTLFPALAVLVVAAAVLRLTREKDGAPDESPRSETVSARPLPLESAAPDPLVERAPEEPAAEPPASTPAVEKDPAGALDALEDGWARLAAHDALAAEAAFQRVLQGGAGGAAVESARDGLAVVALAQGDRALAERRLAESSGRRPSRVQLLLSLADDDLRRGDAASASLRLTKAVEASIEEGAGFADLSPVVEKLDAVNRDLVFNPRGTWRSEAVEVIPGDSWHKIAKKLGRERGVNAGIGLLRAMNRRTGDHLDVGESVRVPLDPIRIDIHRSAFACLVYLGERIVRVYPIGLGREGSETPAGQFAVGKKDPRPIWWKPNPPSPPLPYGHPENPLGERWIGFRADGRDTEYGLHGTNSEQAILSRVSNGCVRLRNADVVELYDLLPDSGTPVQIH